MEIFTEIVNGFQLLTISSQSFSLHIWLGSEFAIFFVLLSQLLNLKLGTKSKYL